MALTITMNMPKSRYVRIANEILMYFRSQRKLQSEVSLSDSLDSDPEGNSLSLMDVISVDDNMLEVLDARDSCVKVRRIVDECLTSREAMIIRMRYGLDQKAPKTQREIAAGCGISRSYVYKPAYYKWMESRVTIHFFISIIGQACPNSIGFARVWGIPSYCLPVDGQAFANRRASGATTDKKWTGRNFLKAIRKELRNMADVKWIKLAVDFFDDEKVLLISNMPDGYIIILVWVKLLCLAGKQNNSGVFTLSNGVPYTEKMLATIFRLDEAIVSRALKTFGDFGMIQIVNGAFTITNWGKHQNLDKIEAYNEYQRNYMREYRAKQKAIATGGVQSKAKSKPNSKTKIREAEKELKIEQDKDVELLILDDMGAEKTSDWVCSVLFEIIDHRYNACLPLLVTTNCVPEELKKQIGARNFDRLREMCSLVSVTAKSQRPTAAVT